MSTPIMPDTDTARALLRETGIIVADDRIVPVPGGTINTTYRILQDPPLILRIAPGDEEAEAGPGWMTSHGLRREAAVFSMLEPLSHLLPRTVHIDWSRKQINRDWVLQTQVRGRSWSDVHPELTVDEHRDLWRQLGDITRTIHAVPGAEFGPPEEGFGHGAWSDLVRWDVTGFLVDAQRFNIETDPFQRLTTLINEAVTVLDRVGEPRLIHSDLNSRHVFVRRASDGGVEISGLIDMEFARFADPYSESVFVMDALRDEPDPAFDAFCEAYGCEHPTRDSRLRSIIYQLTALGWTVMDLHRREQPEGIPNVLDTMARLLEDAEELV